MNGKSSSIPVGMIFKKHYCSNCGARLEKERTHRVVTKDDKDYYQYHEVGTYPRRDYDVYSYRFKCTECNRRISYGEQCIIARIQRKTDKKVLIDRDIQEHYTKAKEEDKRIAHILNLFMPFVFLAMFFIPYFVFKENVTNNDYLFCLICCGFVIFSTVINEIRRCKGNSRIRHKQDHSYDEKALFEQIHTYASNNRELLLRSNRCFCFHCKREFSPEKIERYLDGENTALCPYCQVDAVLPDAIECELNDEMIEKMNRYWF